MSTNPKIEPVVEPGPSNRRRRRAARARAVTYRAPPIFVALYFSILVYPVVRLLGLLFPAWTPGTLELLAIIVLPIACRMLHERYPTPATRTLAGVALTWLGVCFQLFWIMLIFELVNLVAPLPAHASGVAIATCIVALSIVGFVNAQLLHVKRVVIPGPTTVRGRTLVQISDVHIGSRSPRLLRRIVDRVNALKPDYVLITGDLIDFAGISRAELAPLGTFNAPAIFAIGNHERYVDLAAIDERHAGARRDRVARRSADSWSVSVHRHRRRRHRGADSGSARAHRAVAAALRRAAIPPPRRLRRRRLRAEFR